MVSQLSALSISLGLSILLSTNSKCLGSKKRTIRARVVYKISGHNVAFRI